MLTDFLLLFAGLALVVFGADFLVDGASDVARRFGLSEFVIGLTIVGMGTSAPEMVVSFIGALQGKADIAIGNVVGSNFFNTLLILGLTALILPMPMTRDNRRRDIPMNLGMTVLLVLLGMKGTLFGLGQDGLSRLDGGILLLLFILYMWGSFRSNEKPQEAAGTAPPKKLWLSLLMIVGGLAGLIIGGNWFVNSATAIAKGFGVSDKFIAITLLAGGTSMPELATCIVAAAKKKGQLALGNIIGSNIFNILLILGGSALITPLSFAGLTWIDLGALVASAVALVSCVYIGRRNELDRLDGTHFLLLWVIYMTWLIIHL